MRTASQRLLGPSVLLLIAVLFYWKLTLTNRYTWLNNADATNQILPWMQFQAVEWHHGRFPLWDPNGWFGQSLIGQGQPGAAYPPNWLLFLVPLDHGWIRQAALNWYFVLIRYFAALACYALARELGRSRAASILAGCIYGLGGYVAHTTSPQMVNGAVWTPLVFLFLFRAERGVRPLSSAVLSGFFLGFGWLAGHHQMNLFVAMAAAALWVWLTVREGKLSWVMARLAAISLIVAALASAFQTIPMAEYGRRSVRWVGAAAGPVHFNQTVPYPIHGQYSLRPAATLGIFLPDVEYNFGFYIGIVAFALGILGTIVAWRERQVRWLSAVGLGAIFFALGENSLFHGVLYSLVPLVEKARVPAAAAVLFALSAATLAAFGADRIAKRQEWSRRFGWALAIASAAIATAAFVIFAAKIHAATDHRLIVPAIAGVLGAAIFASSRKGVISPQAALICTIGLVLFELNNVSTYAFANRLEPNRYLDPLSEHADLISFIRSRGEHARVEYDNQAIPYNIGDWYGIETFQAYLVSLTTNIWAMDLYSPKAKDFFAIRYSLGKVAPRDGLVEVFTGSSGLKVFENPDAFPRVWSVHRTVVGADADVSARNAVWGINGTNPILGACSGASDDVQMPVHQPNYIRMNAALECRGMIVLTDSWFPGWWARVDARSAPIYEVYGGVRGVLVDGGRHTIEMRYRPASVFLGAALSLFAAMAAVWAGASSFRRSAFSL